MVSGFRRHWQAGAIAALALYAAALQIQVLYLSRALDTEAATRAESAEERAASDIDHERGLLSLQARVDAIEAPGPAFVPRARPAPEAVHNPFLTAPAVTPTPSR